MATSVSTRSIVRSPLTSCSLLVIIGFTAGFIISLFPRPQSAKVTVRKSIAKTVDRLAELYTEEVKGFILEANLYAAGTQQTLDIEERATRYRTRFLGLVVSMISMSGTSLTPRRAKCKTSHRKSPMRDLNRHCADHGHGQSTRP